MDQALIDQIVSNVLARLQPAPARPVVEPLKETPTVPSRPAPIEVTSAVITASLLAEKVRGGQTLAIGRHSILTPSARDWLNTKKITWTRLDSVSASHGSARTGSARWQLIVQTVTSNSKAIYEGLQRQPEGWKSDLVGLPNEAAAFAVKSISTAEFDGVAVVSEYAEIIACQTNRNPRVRAAVITDRKQLDLTRQHLGVNVVCINPNGRTFMELKNLLRDCAAMKPVAPAGWS